MIGPANSFPPAAVGLVPAAVCFWSAKPGAVCRLAPCNLPIHTCVYPTVGLADKNNKQLSYTMKKFTIIALGLLTATALTVSAAEKKEKKPLTDDQKKVLKEITDKYDLNKDGKLDKEESAKISDDDKKKMKDAGLPGAPAKKKDK